MMDKVILNGAEIGAAVREYLLEQGLMSEEAVGFKWNIAFKDGDILISGDVMESLEVIITPYYPEGWVATPPVADAGGGE